MPRSKHYYQGGYDYDIISEVKPEYECPICLLCARNPYQTSCGHRFCYSCILTWLQDGKTCPHDNSSLGEGDMFHDTIAERQIMQLMAKCPLWMEGCTVTTTIANVENHYENCSFRKHRLDSKQKDQAENLVCNTCGEVIDKDEAPTFHPERSETTQLQHKLVCPKELVACTFAGAGCLQSISRSELPLHLETHISQHLQLLWEKLLKFQQVQIVSQPPEDQGENNGASASSSEADRSLERGDFLRLSGSQKLIRDLFHRMVSLEQKLRELDITLEQLKTKQNAPTASISCDVEALNRFCNGNIVWKLENFSSKLYRMKVDFRVVFYSHGFYTSVYGYQLCLRCCVKIINGTEYLGIFVHLMKGCNDDTLTWPFHGKIHLRIKNQEDYEDFEETIDAHPNSEAFQRPRELRNPIGFGLQNFIPVHNIFSRGFANNTDIFIVRARVETFSD